MKKSLNMKLRPEVLSIARLSPDDSLPAWATEGPLWSVVRSEDEVSIVCRDASIPAPVQAERGWRALQLAGPIPFGLTGILASILEPLAAAQIGIFAFSTFDTDYVLVKNEDLARSLAALRQAGHVIL